MLNVHFLSSDLKRLFKGYALYVSIIGVAVSLFFSLERIGLVNDDVLSTYNFATNMSGMMIAYVFCAFPYATSLCEDMEYHYIRYGIARGSLKKYVLSKISVIYVTSILVMVLGSILFLLLCRTQGPWVNSDSDSFKDAMMGGLFGGLIKTGHYALYCVCSALRLGLLAGVFSALAAFLSLFITNKVMVLVLPVLVYQVLLENTSENPGIFSISTFRGPYTPFEQDWQSLLFIFSLSLGLAALLGVGIYKKLKTRL